MGCDGLAGRARCRRGVCLRKPQQLLIIVGAVDKSGLNSGLSREDSLRMSISQTSESFRDSTTDLVSRDYGIEITNRQIIVQNAVVHATFRRKLRFLPVPVDRDARYRFLGESGRGILCTGPNRHAATENWKVLARFLAVAIQPQATFFEHSRRWTDQSSHFIHPKSDRKRAQTASLEKVNERVAHGRSKSLEKKIPLVVTVRPPSLGRCYAYRDSSGCRVSTRRSTALI